MCLNDSGFQEELQLRVLAPESDDHDGQLHTGHNGPIAIELAIKGNDMITVQTWIDQKRHQQHGLDCGIGLQKLTALHFAAKYKKVEIARKLIEAGVDLKKTDVNGDTALHLACQTKDDINPALVDVLINPQPNADGSDEVDFVISMDYIDAQGTDEKTALHLATEEKDEVVVKKLLDKGAKVSKLDCNKNSPIHLAASKGYSEVVKMMIECEAECIDLKTGLGIKKSTPLHLASRHSHTKTVEVLLAHGANFTEKNTDGYTALGLACKYGSTETVQVLLDAGVEDKRSLELAISRGHKSIVMALVKSKQWRTVLRHKYYRHQNQEGNKKKQETTPFRELIRTMPDVAEEVLNKCTISDPEFPDPGDEHYTIYFDYEFVEDFSTLPEKKFRQGCDPKPETYFNELHNRSKKEYNNEWGPTKYDVTQHPLSIMVRKDRKLLTHPLIKSLLHKKWNEFGWLFYLDFVIYALFMFSLTVLALLLPNPQTEQCVAIATGNATIESDDGTHSNCSTSTVVLIVTYVFAALTMLFALIRVAWEVFELCVLRLNYLMSWTNYIEWPLYIFSIIFASFVFIRECQCPSNWQWEIGTVAVFLSWLNLIAFISETPLNGLYLHMFNTMLVTFMKAIFLPLLFVVAFALTFYMCFHEPGINRSPFSHPARSILRTMTMTIGEIDTDGVFRQDISGASDSREEVPFPVVSYIIWATFIIFMPVLITNLLIGLAVGDISEISKKAEETKLAFQVQQVLSVEQLLPMSSRRWHTSGKKKLRPNKQRGYCKKITKRINLFLWGQEDYGNHTSLNRAMCYKMDSEQKVECILVQLKNLENTILEMKSLLQSDGDENDSNN